MVCYISPDDIKNLFNAFFTKGKKGGTGLGLAIAQKVIRGHGGEISCLSERDLRHPEGRVEFIFTLPVATGALAQNTKPLPHSNANFVSYPATLANTKDVAPSLNRGEAELESMIAAAKERLGSPMWILVVDDEAVYRNAMRSFLEAPADAASAVVGRYADSSDSALQLVADLPFQLIITDLDLGAESLDGFELVRAIREKQRPDSLRPLICIHSNRIMPADHQKALASGADIFLPKPIARAQLLRLILQAVPAEAAAVAVDPPPAVASMEIALVEDNPFILEEWTAALSLHSTVYSMASPESLQQQLAKDPELLARLSFVIVDFHFDNSSLTGADLAVWLKGIRPNLPVIIASDSSLSLTDFGGTVDRIMSKNGISFEALAKFRAV